MSYPWIIVGLILIAAALAIYLLLHSDSAKNIFGLFVDDADQKTPDIDDVAKSTNLPSVVKATPVSSGVHSLSLNQPVAHSEKFDASSAPPYPVDEVVLLNVNSLPKTWACLRGSVKGFNKQELQDAHEVVISGDNVALLVCDGAGSKKHSKAGADLVVTHLKEKLVVLFETSKRLDAANWRKIAEETLLSAVEKLSALANEQGNQLSDYGCTAIVAVATRDYVFCAHVGDGRAGYLDAKGVFRSMMTPFKGAEANATVFVTMLTAENIADRLRTFELKLHSRALMALSDGPEQVCWHTSTLDKSGTRLTDPNVPSAKFFGKIAQQFASATASKTPQDELNAKWAEFLTSGNPSLATEVDDKTLLFALRA